MGQKANPNSFNLKNTNLLNFGGHSYVTEYPTLVKEQLLLSKNLTSFFEKKRSVLLKNCFFFFNNEKSSLILYISFFFFKELKNRSQKRLLTVSKKKVQMLNFQKIMMTFFTSFGYPYAKRLIFYNLNKLVLNKQKANFEHERLNISNPFLTFKNEIYFNSIGGVIALLLYTSDTALFFSKFIAKFFKMFYRTKKINRFFFFLKKLIEVINSITGQKTHLKGLKIQIKGRFNASARTKIKLFEKGSVSLQTITNKISYSLIPVNTTYGVFGIKVWISE